MDNKELYEALMAKMDRGFNSVKKRLDGVEYRLSQVEHELGSVKLELKKIDTVLNYTEQYDNIPT